ncbi:MAG: DNA mismatch repair endonuclease MutL [Verrucomicrobiota bacterium]|nr:DNA mismatch repair endonuclease MutL [Verrucomicrobiota bacterium]
MNRIRLLPEQVANQIAAGEVIERPASVVKELVENAVDAQATNIIVEIHAGGRSLVRVTDDGVGMSRDDALLCFERHATSKIQSAHDLASIRTMGFRGEAMPSIASISRLSLTTRERDSVSEEGTQVVINGGKILEVKAAGSAPGTSIEVRQIFYNLPARRKFLRSEETERAHIQHYLTLVALAHPEIGFTFLQDGRLVWKFPAVPQASRERDLAALRERIRAVYPGDLKLLPVDFSAELPIFRGIESSEQESEPEPFRVWGFIGAPGVSRSTREDQHLFVNKRPIESRPLNFALIEGYHTSLMKGRFPVCCLFLEVDPATVDVNIHPAKREVKFRQEQAVRRALTDAIRETLLNFHTTNSPRIATVPPPSLTLETDPPPATLAHAVELPGLQKFTPAPPPVLPQQPIRWPEREPRPAMPALPAAMPSPPPSPLPAQFPEEKPVPLLQVPLRLVGVIGKLYVLLESDRGLVLLDQHAAHERILFEQMLSRLEQGNVPAQRLLLPETLELSSRDAQFLREQLPHLVRVGLGISEFGERTFLLDALPPFVKTTDAKKFVLDVIDSLKIAGQEINSWRMGEHTIAKTVCRHAVKANDLLSVPELENLVHDLRACAMPYTCPHGRPTLIEMNYRELEKKFGRTQ